MPRLGFLFIFICKWFLLLTIAAAGAALCTLHLGTLATNPELKADADTVSQSYFLARTEQSPNHLFLFGSGYERGLAEGNLTAPLLIKTEDILFQEFFRFFPNQYVRWAFILAIMRWFSGGETYLNREFLELAQGIAKSIPPGPYDSILDRYTRGVAYHGIHEVGQLFVDIERDDFGCTVMALPQPAGGWIVGRNFDFEVGRFFDEEKILKWHFPTEGQAYVSVIWPGMIGTVTGVNEAGVYVSINAAGSRDFRRYGKPSTVLISEVLQTSLTAKQAVTSIEESPVFISDIYLSADANDLYKVEKTPQRFATMKANQAIAVSNHLSAEKFADDSVNKFRRLELTSEARLARAQQLVEQGGSGSGRDMAIKMQEMLRDRSDTDGRELHLGNRRAIDALIATHGVIFDSQRQYLYVSQGPALVGRFLGFDLRASFKARKPVTIADLPTDPKLNSQTFYAMKTMLKELSEVDNLVARGQCSAAETRLKPYRHTTNDLIHTNLLVSLGKFASLCLKDAKEAKRYFASALALKPAYAKQRNFLEQQL